jgi:putative DNA primase/helicase
MATVQSFLARLRGVRPRASGWQALCPAHADKNPSLSIDVHGDKILIHCHAGCSHSSVLEELGIDSHELFLGARNSQPHIIATYDYVDARGKLLYQVVRSEPKNFRQRRPNGKDGWRWNLNGVPRVLYRLPEVIASDEVVIVEGEKDVETARTLSLVATCSVGGAGKWKDEYSESLCGKRITIMADADAPGRVHAVQVATSLAGKVESLKVLELPGAKDLTEYIERGGTHESLLELIERAPQWRKLPSTAITRAFSDIKPQALRWLWPGRIPLGKLTLLVGDPGLGKSLLTVDIASRITQGMSFPDGARCEPGSVIIASAEDDPADTIRPRLDAAGADVSRIHILEGVRVNLSDGRSNERPFHLEAGIEALEDVLSRMSDVRLIIIDPISAYLGHTDSNSNADIRRLLTPLAVLAAKYHVAVLCVTHLRKSAGTAVQRAIASIAFTAASRASWVVAADPSSSERRLMLVAKQNLGPDIGGLAFRVATANGLPILQWESGAVALKADDVLNVVENRESHDARREAESWLREQLASGPVPTQTLQTNAKTAGLAWATVRRAKESLPIVAAKSGYRGGWEWRLEGAQPTSTQQSTFEEISENK